MKAVICASAVALAALTTSAKAEPANNWTGFYAGMNAQYLLDNFDWHGANPYIAPPKPCGNCGPPNQDLSGAMIGGTLGYNWQAYNFVYGVEGDFDFGNIKDSQRDGNYLQESTKIQDFSTIRARLGYLVMPDLLIYGTGGVAFENLSYSEACPGDASAVPFGWCRPVAAGGHGPYSLSKSQWNTGYVVGGGAEWAMGHNLSLKVEGLFADFGENDYQLGKMADGKLLPLKKIENSDAILRVGVNYHFN